MPDESQRFPKQARLLRKVQFQRVFDKAIKSSDRFVLVLARPNGGLSSRLGLIVSRKVSRRAVVRNRLKRVIRESFRTHGIRLAGIDFVVLCRADATALSNHDLTSSLLTHWDRIRTRLCGKS